MSRRRLVQVIVLLGALAALAPLVAVDPSLLALLLDVDLLALVGAAGWALLREDSRLLALRLAGSLPVLWARVGVSLTREAPRTLAP